METKWIFKSYHNEDDYKSGTHYFQKIFNDFNELKMFSASHSHESKNPKYVSQYQKIDSSQKFYDNRENISPEEIIRKMKSLGNGPNRDKRFIELSLYGDSEMTMDDWIIKYTAK